jgi:phage terminase small subunit
MVTRIGSPLGARQRRFVEEYFTDLNATRAAIAAGYSKRTASQAGWEVLRNPKVSAEISRRQQLLSQRLEVTAENVTSELAKIAFASLGDFYGVAKGGRLEVDAKALADPVKAAALSQVEITEGADGKQVIKIRLADKRAALNDLGRHLGLFNDRSEFSLIAAPPEEGRMDLRQLAMGALALLSAAEHASRSDPAMIEAEPYVRKAEASRDDFDFDD